MADERFIGTWRLVSFETRTDDGTVSYPYGPDAKGYILCGADGYMAVVIQSGVRERFAHNDYRGGTPEELVAAGAHFISYSGPFEVVGDDMVLHHVELTLRAG